MLTPEKWARVDELFHRALEIDLDKRSAWLAETCADEEVTLELRSLLASHHGSDDGFVAQRVKDAVLAFHSERPKPSVKRAGPYRLVKQIGQGGMGTVYLAERDDDQYETQVAVKLVRPGMDTDFILARFRRERQALANMQHPNIARLLDGGTTDEGLPFIVMEYIDGNSIIDFCENGHLSLEKRIRLFLCVCDAVEHAHRRFVIHRDLKPGNILVDRSGNPKLLDFGICKLLQASPFSGSETMSGAQLLTPDYASPEQVRGDGISVATDLYSLAAILYEMLTGVKAHRIEKYTPAGLEKAICEQEVLRPSLAAKSKSNARFLAVDLDNVLLKALDKNPNRRYVSVEQFSEDLKRHLEHLPVRARPASLSYRAAKFGRRNRAATIAASCVFAALVTGLVLFAREVKIAQRRLADVRGLATVFVFDVHDAIKDLPGSTRARKLIVQTGLRYLDSLAPSAGRDWDLQQDLAGAYQRIGDVQGNLSGSHLGEVQDALVSYQKSLLLFDSIARHNPESQNAQLNRVIVKRRIGDILADGKPNEAIAAYQQAIEMSDTWLRHVPRDFAVLREVGSLYVAKSEVMRLAGNYKDAQAQALKGTAILRDTAHNQPDDRELALNLAKALSQVGAAEQMMNDLKDAQVHYRESADLVDELVKQNPANSALLREKLQLYEHLGDVMGYPGLANLGDRRGASAAFEKALQAARALHNGDLADQSALSEYAMILSRLATVLPEGDTRKQLDMIRESLSLLRQWNHDNPQALYAKVYLGFEQEQLGDALRLAGNRTEAIRAYQEGLSYSKALLSIKNPSAIVTFISCSRRLGGLSAAAGHREEALRYAQRALQVGDPATETGAVSRAIPPRAYAAMGLVYADLLHAKNGDSSQDQLQARNWLRKAIQGWHELQISRGLSAVHLAELKEAEVALASLSQKAKS